MNKCVKILDCPTKLSFVKAIKESTGKSLLEAKNIADSVVNYDRHTDKYVCGTLLLNESSITPEQWEQIVKYPGLEIKWEYVSWKI